MLHNNHKKTSKSKKTASQQDNNDQSNIAQEEEFNILYNKAKELFPESNIITSVPSKLLHQYSEEIKIYLINTLGNNRQIDPVRIENYLALMQSILQCYVKYKILFKEISLIRNIISMILFEDIKNHNYLLIIKDLLILLITKAIPQNVIPKIVSCYSNFTEDRVWQMFLLDPANRVFNFYECKQFDFLPALRTYLDTEGYKDLVDSVKNEKVKAILNKYLT